MRRVRSASPSLQFHSEERSKGRVWLRRRYMKHHILKMASNLSESQVKLAYELPHTMNIYALAFASAQVVLRKDNRA